MSKKFLEQVSSTGISRKKVESKFGMKILAKCGWTEGEGLGKNKSGIVECIQIRRKEENLGLGASLNKSVWNDQWWQNSYDNILKNVNLDLKHHVDLDASEEDEEVIEKTNNKLTEKKYQSDEDDLKSNTSTTSENSQIQKEFKKTNKKKVIESEDDDEDNLQFLHKKRKRKIKFLKL